MTIKLVFTASLLDAQHKRENVENKPASSLVPSQKALGVITPFLKGRKADGNFSVSSL